MGVEPFLVASSLEMVVAQRLVRLICPDCKTPVETAEDKRLRQQFGTLIPEVLYHGTGCENCNQTGFRGRQGIFEMMPMTDELRTHITARDSAVAVRKTAVAQGMNSLREDGWRLIESGLTTVDEVLRVTKDERDATLDTGGA